MMAAFDDILDLMRPMLPGLPVDMPMIWAARKAARKLCQESSCLRMPVTVYLVAGYSRYRLVPNWPTYSDDEASELSSLQVIGVKAIQVNGYPYDPVLPQTFRQCDGSDNQVVVYEPDEVEIFPTPHCDRASGLVATVVLIPKPSANVLPRKLAVQYANQIAGGAVGMLKAMPNEAWTDPAGAGAAAMEFQKDIDIARVRADMQGMPRGFRVKGYN